MSSDSGDSSERLPLLDPAFVQKLKSESALGLNRRRGETLVVLKVPLEAHDKNIGRDVIDVGGLAYNASAQESQHLAHAISLATPGLSTDGLMPTPPAPLELLDRDVAEISQRHPALREPSIERECMQCLDMNDCRDGLLIRQRRNQVVEMSCQRASGALIGSRHDAPLNG